jgi:hypothetical protein
LACGLLSPAVRAEVLVEKSGKFGPQPTSSAAELEFEVRSNESPVLSATVTLQQGSAKVLVLDSEKKALVELTTAGKMQIADQSVNTSGKPGHYYLRVVPEDAVGDWQVKVVDPIAASEIRVFLLPAVGMMAVALAALVVWRLQSGAQWRWFWVGAGVWTVGVAMKFAFAIPLNGPILRSLDYLLPRAGYLAVGSIYIGALTGVFEIGVTLIAALIWKAMARDATRGVAVGVGAGSFEAALIGLASLSAVVAAMVGPAPLRESLFSSASAAKSMTLFWLVGPVERVIAILCHTSSRALVLWGVARGRVWGPFAAAFLIMTAIDTVAGYSHLAGVLSKISAWWIELAIAPAAIVSIPIILWCVRHWPVPSPDTASPDAASTDKGLAP